MKKRLLLPTPLSIHNLNMITTLDDVTLDIILDKNNILFNLFSDCINSLNVKPNDSIFDILEKYEYDLQLPKNNFEVIEIILRITRDLIITVNNKISFSYEIVILEINKEYFVIEGIENE